MQRSLMNNTNDENHSCADMGIKSEMSYSKNVVMRDGGTKLSMTDISISAKFRRSKPSKWERTVHQDMTELSFT